MAGFDRLLSGGFDFAAGAYALPVWIAGAFAALLFCVGVLAFFRAAQAGRTGVAWRVLLVLVGAGLAWVLVETLGGRDLATARRALDARAAELTLRFIAPGSPLACLDGVANPTLEEACEKSLFANPETVAAAVAYVDARLALLVDGLDLAARDRGYSASIERLRRAIEADRFGMVAHVFATRGCTADDCVVFKFLRDPQRVIANMRERSFDAHVVLHAATWRPDAPAQAQASVAPSGPALAAAPPPTTTTGTAPLPSGGRFEFPSAASIPAISIMNAEPALPPGEANAVPVQNTGSPAQNTASPARAAAPRRQSARDAAAPPSAPQQAQSVPLPASPPGTLSNPR